jgi:hypothetical protein
VRYLRSYLFVFDSPNWVVNLLFVILCLLIPIIGAIVVIGYFFEVIESLLGSRWRGRDGAFGDSSEAITLEPVSAIPFVKSARAGDHDAITAEPPVVLSVEEDTPRTSYPDFTFERFSEYLKRGIWPFLVNLIVNLPAGLLLSFVMFLGMIGLGLAAAHSGLAFAVVLCLLVLLYVVILLVMAIVSKPFYLRAGLSRDFGTAFSLTFFRDFLNRVGKEVVLAALFLAGTGMLLTILGLLACYIGIFPAAALLIFAQHHLDFQLYDLYLKRGGTLVLPNQTGEPYRKRRYD